MTTRCLIPSVCSVRNRETYRDRMQTSGAGAGVVGRKRGVMLMDTGFLLGAMRMF